MNAGCRVADVSDSVQGVRVPMRLLYPTHATTQAVNVGPYTLDVAIDAPVAGEDLPLIVISHGTGSSPWLFRDLAGYLANEGFVVALPEHTGNSRSDDSLAGTVVNLQNRPRHVRLGIDAAYADPVVGPRLVQGGVVVIGHSLGGYTALAVAGGQPWAFGPQTTDGVPYPFPVVHDPRVSGLILLAPATAWFMGEGALAHVGVPILMLTGEHDEFAPDFHGDVVLRGVPDRSRVDHRVIPNAGHFAFVSPFPPSMNRPDFLPSQDPPGFDRAAYVGVLAADVTAFIRRLTRVRRAPGSAAAR
jgi:predicted dienelactone hydrolase